MGNKELPYVVHQELITGKVVATLIGGEFDNCHGQGDTEEQALASLKMAVRVRRKIRDS